MALVKAVLESLESGVKVKAWFNPKEYTVSKSVSWNQHKGSATDFPNLQFTTGQPKKLKVDLFFDGYEDKKSVRGDCEKLIKLAEMDSGLHRPPKCKFTWENEKFEGVVDNVSVKYTMFLSGGTPVRATASVSMSAGNPTRKEKSGSPNESPDYAKLHTLRRGETLHALAEAEYDDPAEWRRIADANGIDNPMELQPGMRLLIPPILERHV